MVYFARIVSLLGHLAMKVGVACLLLKMIIEPDLPSFAQGYWLEMILVIGIGAVFLFVGNRLGSDIFGPDDENADSMNTAIRSYHGSEAFMKMLFRYDILRFFTHSAGDRSDSNADWID